MSATVTRALDLLSALVLEDGRAWGEAAAPFQREDARAVLDPTGCPYNFLTRSRGGSKTSDLAAMVLVAMLDQIAPHGHAYGIAADRDQARLLLDSCEGFVRRTPDLRGAFEVSQWRILCRSTGVTFDVLAADAASSWGLRPDFLVADELCQWGETAGPRKLWEAMSSAAAKMSGCRLVAISTAGDPAHWSRKILEHAKADSLWRVHEVRGPSPWLDPTRVEEQRRQLLPSTFARLFMNEWTAAEDRLASADDVAACVTLDGAQDPVPGLRYVIGLDLGLKKDRSVAAVCHLEDRSRVVLDRMQVWSGTRANPVRLDDVESWIIEARQQYRGARLVADPWQSVGMSQRLRERGVSVSEFPFSAQSVGRLAVTLFNLVRDHLLAIPDDSDLVDELSNVRLREATPGVYRIDHDPDRHDDRVIAIALAAQQLLERRARGARTVIPIGMWAPSAWNPGSAALEGGSGATWGSATRDRERDAFGWDAPTIR